MVFAEDEEQVDKLLGLGDRIPSVRHIVYSDPRGMRKYRDPRLMSAAARGPRGGAARAAASPSCTTVWWMRPTATRSRCCARPPARRRIRSSRCCRPGALLGHCAGYLAFDPKGPDDEYVSVLPLPWIMEQVYALGMA